MKSPNCSKPLCIISKLRTRPKQTLQMRVLNLYVLYLNLIRAVGSPHSSVLNLYVLYLNSTETSILSVFGAISLNFIKLMVSLNSPQKQFKSIVGYTERNEK